MIASIRGIVQHIGTDHAVIELGGLGLQVFAPRRVLAQLGQVGEPAQLHTYLHVREDALALYGFESAAQRALFETLLGVTGIGPKVALGLLDEHVKHCVVGGHGPGSQEELTEEMMAAVGRLLHR